ncbi:hypothetical protein Trydic_g20569 [Trypoxylus dichotomus]
MSVLLVLLLATGTYSTHVHIQHSKRIINGTQIVARQCPYYALLYYGGVHSGGVIIRDNVILTAASVVDGFNDTDIEIFVGINSISDTYILFPYDNRRTIKHPQYKYGNANYDVALMFLEDPVGFNGNVQQIGLASTRAPIGSTVGMCGFGYAYCNKTSNSADRCQGVASYYPRWGDFQVRRYEGNTMFASGYGVSSCFGDFGGPVVQNNELKGIASLIQYQNCTGDNLIVSIPAVRPWIEETIRQQLGTS